MIFVFLFLTSVCIIDSRFTHLIRTDSNLFLFIAHSSTLAWKIPWTEEPGGLQSMGVINSWIWLNVHTHTTLYTLNQTNPGPEDVDWLSQAGRSLGWRFQVSAARNPLQQLGWVCQGKRDLSGLYEHIWYPHYHLRDTGERSKKASLRSHYLWRLMDISFSPYDFKLF